MQELKFHFKEFFEMKENKLHINNFKTHMNTRK